MDCLPFALVPERALDQVRRSAQAALHAWCEPWGVAGSAVACESRRWADLPQPPEATWRACGLRSWLGVCGRPVDAVHALLFGAAAQADEAQASMQCAEQAAAELETLLQSLLPESRAGASTGTPQSPVPPSAGDGLVMLRLGLGDAAFVLLAPLATWGLRSEWPAPALEPLSPALLAAALRGVQVCARVELGTTDLPLADLIGLRPGDVVVLDRRVDEPLQLCTPGGETGVPVHLGRSGEHYAVQILRSATGR